jgi:hypothetical protein
MDGIKRPGSHLTFNGRGGSGVYLYRLQAGDVQVTKRMILTK